MKIIKLFNAVVVSLTIVSCSQSKFIVAPPFTNVEKISKIEVGQTKDDVSKKLGIEPYDILYLNDGGYLCFYNYRLVDRKIMIDNSIKNRNEGTGATLSSETGQSAGEPFYTEWKRVYVNFKDGKVTHYATDAGLEDANYIQLVNGTIKLLSKKDLEMENFYSNDFIGIINRSDNVKTIDNIKIDNKSLNIENLLFQLKKNGEFKHTDSPRKNNKGILNIKN